MQHSGPRKIISDLQHIGDCTANNLSNQEISNILCSILKNDILNVKELMDVLIELKNYHKATATHCIRVGIVAGAISLKLGFESKDVTNFIISGLLHDVGKMRIPLEIINKKGKLTTEEFNMIRTHPLHSHNMICNMSCVNPSILDGVLNHHEKKDGSGYPHKLKSDCVSCFAQLVSVADIFDAITSERSYRTRAPANYAALCIINDVGKLDKNIVKDALGCIKKLSSELISVDLNF